MKKNEQAQTQTATKANKGKGASNSIGKAALKALKTGTSLVPATPSTDLQASELLLRKDALFQPLLLKSALGAEQKAGNAWKAWAAEAFKAGLRLVMLASPEGKDSNALLDALKDSIAKIALDDRQYKLVSASRDEVKTKFTGAQKEERRALMQSPLGPYVARCKDYLGRVEEATKAEANGGAAQETAPGGKQERRNLGERMKEQMIKWTEVLAKLKSPTEAESGMLNTLKEATKQCKYITCK